MARRFPTAKTDGAIYKRSKHLYVVCDGNAMYDLSRFACRISYDDEYKSFPAPIHGHRTKTNGFTSCIEKCNEARSVLLISNCRHL